MALSLASALGGIPTTQIRDLAAHLLQSGASADEVVSQIVSFLDGLVDDTALLGPEIGGVLEAIDGPLLRLAIGLIVHSVDRRLRRKP